MIISMTGFGLKKSETNEFTISVEVKSLNSKFLDLSIRLPRIFSDKELEVRNMAALVLGRGKASVTVDFQLNSDSSQSIQYNSELFKTYFINLKQLAESVGASEDDLFKTALQAPDVIQTIDDNTKSKVFWDEIGRCISGALQECHHFREKEGANLQVQVERSIGIIADCKIKVEELEPARTKKVRARLITQLEEIDQKTNIDENRLEQELIFYIEKLDISEELVRLKSHLDYFTEILAGKESNGKKLGFISQEIGREVNTIGSKANDASIQKLVVQMKDELEKIKEQVLNVV